MFSFYINILVQNFYTYDGHLWQEPHGLCLPIFQLSVSYPCPEWHILFHILSMFCTHCWQLSKCLRFLYSLAIKIWEAKLWHLYCDIYLFSLFQSRFGSICMYYSWVHSHSIKKCNIYIYIKFDTYFIFPIFQGQIKQVRWPQPVGDIEHHHNVVTNIYGFHVSYIYVFLFIQA